MWILFYLHPCWVLIDFYFLYSHHLTAFLCLTLLILGIASLLASDVVLCYRPKLVWNSFISKLLVCFVYFFLSSHSFSVVWCLLFSAKPQFDSYKTHRCWVSRLSNIKYIDADIAFLNCSFVLFWPNYQNWLHNSKWTHFPEQITVTSKGICCVNLVGLLLSGQADAGCNYQDNWALFLWRIFKKIQYIEGCLITWNREKMRG